MKVKTITLKILISSKDFMRHGVSGNDKGNKALIFYARPNRERTTIRETSRTRKKQLQLEEYDLAQRRNNYNSKESFEINSDSARG
ncbi:hypothetical protein L2E82_22884 [Cichorium intybus]|uniref:Uncharacterized protein n=1 Tax=Cichorium intybus TaxID=13427 RepID=A0ACB9DYK9_CICIN|nr:hypothetical protein L2E82_22884 [Cichorium intybus]